MCADQLVNVKFVNVIEANPCLWDINSKRKNDRAFVNNTWDRIANQFNEPAIKCRERWRNIRTALFQNIKRYPSESSGKNYYLRSHLKFLIPTIGMRCKTQFQSCSETEDHQASESEDVKPGAFLENCQSSEITDSFRSDTQSKSTLLQLPGNLTAADTLTCNIQHQSDENIPCKRRKRNEEDEEDSDMTFFKSLLRDVRKMNDRQNRTFRVRVMQIANEILDADDQEQPQKGCVCRY